MKKKANLIFCQASITVEASLVLPIFILAVVCLMFFFQIALVQENLQSALEQTAKYAAEWEYAQKYLPIGAKGEHEEDNENQESNENEINREDKVDKENNENEKNVEENENEENKESKDRYAGKDVLDTILLRGVFESYLSKGLIEKSCLHGGVKGVVFLLDLKESDDIIHLTLSYRFRIPISLFGLRDIPSLQAVDVKPFTGFVGQGKGDLKEAEEGKTEYVYITPTGTVYHESATCSHIRITVTSTTMEAVGGLRNENGGKYYPCESCMKHQEQSGGGILFVTQDGERYHNSVTCSKILRTVKEIPREEAGGRRPCARCGRKE